MRLIAPVRNIAWVDRATGTLTTYALQMWQALTSALRTDDDGNVNLTPQAGGGVQFGGVPVLGFVGVQVFTSSGTYTPTSGVTHAVVEMVGGGGGGAGADSGTGNCAVGSGGSAGGYCRFLIDVSSIGTSTLAIGAGGAGGSGNSNGSAGGNTTWADGTTSASAPGGLGGSPALSSGDSGNPGGVAGTAPSVTAGANHVATLATEVGQGGGASMIAGGTVCLSGGGGSSFFGGGGGSKVGRSGVNSAGADGGARGAGGSGAASQGAIASLDGGDGADGLILVYEYTTGAA